jgi:hypothetical protein
MFFLSFLFTGCLVLLALLGYAHRQKEADLPLLGNHARLAGRLGLTDLVLSTEARYTRHPSQADRHSAFQEHPGALEHFPTGSLISYPSPTR